jgi:serine/threonine protein kinase
MSDEKRKPRETGEVFDSRDLFGDLVDEPAPKGERPAAPRKGPIKVRAGGRTTPERLPEDLAALLDAIPGGEQESPSAAPDELAAAAASALGGDARAAGAPATSEPEPPTPTAPDTGLTPTPIAVDALPDLPEYRESERLSADDEAMSDFLKLTARLPKPRARQQERAVDLASVAEQAIDTATPAGADVVLRLPPEPLATGLRYGPYTLVEKIAVGGMAEVFKAKRTGVAGFEKVVAVKRILPHLSYNREFVDMFIDEAKMVAGLQHPNIVQIFDLGRIGTSYYIAMEYVHGADLRTLLRRLRERGLRVPLDVAVFVASKVSAALEHAHAKHDAEGRPMRIVHRDVSPQNILISFDGEVKLVDFGIAKAATKASRTEKGALRGKLMYMSPEQAWGRPMDQRSDLYSLGIVLYEMITDQRPFVGTSDMSLLDKVREGSVMPPRALEPSVPELLERLVLKALSKEPDRRFRDAGDLHQELEDLLKEHPVSAKDVARFVRILVDPLEGSPTGSDLLTGSAAHLEVDLEPSDASPTEPDERESSSAYEPLGISALLRRFGDTE